MMKAINAFSRFVSATGLLPVLALTFTLALVAPLGATPIAPGGSLVPSNGNGDPLGVFITSLDTPFVAATFHGSLHAEVYWTLAGLEFQYRITNAADSPHPIGRLTINGFDSLFFVDVSQRSDLAGSNDQSFSGADRSIFGTLGWTFSGPTLTSWLNPGETSWTAVAKTNAASYTPVSASVIDGSSVNLDTLGPDVQMGTVPEPSTWVLLGSALVGLAIYRRRK